jgi:transcriptional regulator of heat shock response
MDLSERGKTILRVAIGEYIKEAQPIGSNFLVKNYNLGLSSATIRAELQKLTEDGYLLQPHTSAGRVPTDKGYRFFINELMEPKSLANKESVKIKSFLKEKKGELESDIPSFNKNLAKIMSEISGDLVVTAGPSEESFFYEGVLNLFQKPEFQEVERIRGMFKMIENFRSRMDRCFDESDDFVDSPRVFIGKENPFYDGEDYSIIVSRCDLPLLPGEENDGQKAGGTSKRKKKKSEVVAILGPKRMEYNRNISLLDFISKLDHDF